LFYVHSRFIKRTFSWIKKQGRNPVEYDFHRCTRHTNNIKLAMDSPKHHSSINLSRIIAYVSSKTCLMSICVLKSGVIGIEHACYGLIS
jgi:hypothetical protein